MTKASIVWDRISAWRYPEIEDRLLFREYGAIDQVLASFKSNPRDHPNWQSDFRHAEESAMQALERMLLSPKVVVYGQDDSPDAPVALVPLLPSTRLLDADRSDALLELGGVGANRTYFNVCIVPLLASPNLAERVDGYLDEILTRYLWGDVEIVAQVGDLADRFADVFGSDAGAEIPISDRRKVLASALPPIVARFALGKNQEQKLVEIISDRLANLFSVLSEGQLLLSGRRASDGRVLDIPASFWREPNLSLCLSSGTLLSGQVLWTDVKAGAVGAAATDAFPGELSAGETASGRPFDYDRLADFDAMIAEQLIAESPLYPTKGDVDRELARRERNRLGRNGAGPKDQAVSAEAEKKISDWLLKRMPKTRAALTSKR